MTDQVALTIMAAIKPGEVAALKRLLATMSEDVAGNDVLPFGKLSSTHFARFLVLDGTSDLAGQPIPPQLMFTSDADAPLARHLEELLDVAGDGLDRVYGHCEGYPPAGARSRQRRLAYLRSHMLADQTVYVNTIGRTVDQIRREARLRDAIEDFLDRQQHGWVGWDPGDIRTAIQKLVAGDPDLGWAMTPAAGLPLTWRLKEQARFAATLLGVLALSPMISVGFPIWLVLLRRHEIADVPWHAGPDDARVEALAAMEDRGVQNAFSGVDFIKPGHFRRFTVTAVSFFTNLAARYIFNHGSLFGVKTIHFARWVFIDGKRRVVFAPNYDGSLERYVDDFIDNVAWGLNAHDSNGFGYPRTRFLILDGCKDELPFKRFIHACQVPTQVWYSAYDQLTTLNIANNAAIRAGLAGAMDAGQPAEWLRRL